jgi:hypothetical protein
VASRLPRDPGSLAKSDIHVGILRRCHFATYRRRQAGWFCIWASPLRIARD